MEKSTPFHILSPAVIMITCCFFTSCEKEDYGYRLGTTENRIEYLSWSESSDKIIYVESDQSDYSHKSLHAIDINSKDSWKIADIEYDYGSPVFTSDDRIYYFKNVNYIYYKLYSVDIDGSSPVLLLDSLSTPLFSTKYVTFMKYYNLPDTSFYRTYLYDLDLDIKVLIESGRSVIPVSISPDGSQVLLQSWESFSGNTILSIYNTSSGEETILNISSSTNFYSYFWFEDEVLAANPTYTGFEVINLVTGEKVNYPENFNYTHSYLISPTARTVVYLEVEYPEFASGLVGNHYYLHVLKAGASEKAVYDLEREYISETTISFSPDDTRIAYVRDHDNIFIMNL